MRSQALRVLLINAKGSKRCAQASLAMGSLCVGFAATAQTTSTRYAAANVSTPTNVAPVLNVENFLNPPANVRPKYRWWVTVADMEDAEIAAELKAMQQAGAGGAEEVVFPGDNTSAEYLRTYGFGGSLWNHKVEVMQTEAAKLGMVLDHTESPGWPGAKVVAGATEPYSINDPAVAKQLVYGREVGLPGSARSGAIPQPVVATERPAYGAPPAVGVQPKADKVLIKILAAQCTATCDATGRAKLDVNSVVDLTAQVEDKQLDYAFPEGSGFPWQLLAFYYTADGATGSHAYTSPAYIVDHLSQAGVDAFRDFWISTAFGNNPERGFNSSATQDAIKASGGSALFEDSLELSSNIKWTPKMMERWQALRGYSLTRYLPALAGIGRQGNTQGDFEFGDGLDARIRHDYRQTWSDLFIAGHLEGQREWTHRLGMETRMQAYGDPIEVPSAMAHVDMPEGECGMGFPEAGKFIAVGAHMQSNRTVVSSENCAIGGEVWNTTIGGTDRTANLAAAYRTYAGGVTQHVWHGFGYITTDAQNGAEKVWPWHAGFNHVNPGFAETWAPVMPQWQAGHVRELNDNLARHSLVTRQGLPRFDLAIYWHGHGIGSNGGERPEIESRITTDGPLAQQGYTHEYITDEFINVPSYGGTYKRHADLNQGAFFPSKSAYKALILNNQPSIDVDSARRIFTLAKQSGLPVIVVGAYPTTTPGARDVASEEREVRMLMGDTSAAAIKNRSSLASLVDVSGYNVRHVDSLRDVVSALQDLGIRPAAYHESNHSNTETDSAIQALRRHTDDTDYYLLFNQTNARVAQTVTLAGAGVPYRLDTWTGRITPIAAYQRTAQGITVAVDLAGQDTAIVALSRRQLDGMTVPTSHADLFATSAQYYFYGTQRELRASMPDMAVQPLTDWTLQVESFTSDADTTADSLPGIEHTRRTLIDVGRINPLTDGVLPAWSSITPTQSYAHDLTDISGIGTYRTSFKLDKGWSEGQGAILDLGSATDSVSVIVNGQQLPPIDQQDINRIDIGPYLHAGDNSLTVIVASTLINAVRVAPGTKATSRARNSHYGLTGPVRLQWYTQTLARVDE